MDTYDGTKLSGWRIISGSPNFISEQNSSHLFTGKTLITLRILQGRHVATACLFYV